MNDSKAREALHTMALNEWAILQPELPYANKMIHWPWRSQDITTHVPT